MITDSQTVPELRALEEPLRVWEQHQLYPDLVALFAQRAREVAALQGAEIQPPPRPLSSREARRLSKRLLRTGSIAELDAFVDRVKLRYVAGQSRDDLEGFARLRRERLGRLLSTDEFGAQARPTEKRR